MSEKRTSIARNFSKYPAGRYKADGRFSGERCRRELLVPALRGTDVVVVDLNGTLGYGSSFLEEAFGGLVREEGFSASTHQQYWSRASRCRTGRWCGS